MAKRGSPEHEKELERFLKELEKDGWKVINLQGKSPDGIAVKNRQIIAVEVLKRVKFERKNYDPSKHHGRYVSKYQGGWTKAKKREAYNMFDDVCFSVFN